jgi:ADP-ribose pyrophosphatase YjhB (NUDIX family)
MPVTGPGGRVRNNEKLDTAFERVLDETDLTAKREQARFLGVFQHVYPTNRFESRDLAPTT